MPFAILLALGLALLIAASMARHLPFRGGKLVATAAASVPATLATVLLTQGDPLAILVSAGVGAAIGAVLSRRD